MKAFAFLGGSELDSSSWNGCMGILESAGYRCMAIDWRKALETSGSEGVVDHIIEQLSDLREWDLTLVGHSAGGLLLPEIGLRTQADRAIYVAALVANPGESFYEQIFSNDKIFEDDWVAAWSEEPVDESQIDKLLFHDCPPESRVRYWRASGRACSSL